MSASAELAGTTLAQFKIGARLGAGGMGVVYRATDEKLRRPVALKVLPPELVRDEERRQRFLREARSAAAVTHPNIATVYEIGEADGQVFIAMELVEGRTLREHLAGGPLPLERALRIARGIARGLARAHQAGVVHRDLKPDNVMIGDDDHVKILDFGLAKLFESAAPSASGSSEETATASGATEEGRVLGTPGYMSPEQARGKPVDPRTDVFTFGIVLYELVTGEKPFRGETGMDMLIAITRDPAPPPSARNSAVSSEIDRLVAHCLEKAPAARFPDGAALVGALESLITRSSLSGRVPLEPPMTRRWRPIALVALGVAVALALGAVRFRRSWHRTTAAAHKPVVITDLPRPTNVKPEALAEYDAGVQKLRDDAWAVAEAHFAKAAQLDPTFALAWMRYAMTSPFYETPSRSQEILRRAIELRGALSERDQLYLDSLEPMILREPPDPRESARLVGLACERFPDDAELFVLRGWRLQNAGEYTASLAAYQRAAELDPKSGDAWQGQALALGLLGRFAEANRAVERALTEVPSCNDCSAERVLLLDGQEKCAEAEREMHQGVLKSGHALAYRELAREMFATGRPRETVRNTLQQAWKLFDESRRARTQATDELLLAVHAGELSRALALADAFAHKYATDPNLAVQVTPARMRVALYQEMGRDREAALAALEFLKQRDSWTTGNENSIRDDATMTMLHAQLRAGTISPAAYAEGRQQFIERWRRSTEVTPGALWAYAWAQPAETRAEAVEALAARPDPPPPIENYRRGSLFLEHARVLFLAGHVDEALPGLKKGAASCKLLDEPFYVTRFQRTLGQALEAKSDKPGSCAAYQWILDRWGAVRPKSVTADIARARAKSLACGR